MLYICVCVCMCIEEMLGKCFQSLTMTLCWVRVYEIFIFFTLFCIFQNF